MNESPPSLRLCRFHPSVLKVLFLTTLTALGSNGIAQSPTPDWMLARVLSSRDGHAMAYDAARQRVVLFGGAAGRHLLADTWEWDGIRWVQRSPATSPRARADHAMAYDVARGRVVLFGGSDRGWNSYNDTWEWDGDNWIQRRPVTSPGGLSDHAMAYDAVRQRVVLFGGEYVRSNQPLADTWEWDGANWTKRSPATSPGARVDHAMGYDVFRRRVVLFGGTAGLGGPLAETWEWDGANWTKRSPATSPPGLSRHALVYDLVRQRIVLFGGAHFYNPNADTWEWDGTNWTKRSPATRPPPRYNNAMAYDVARGRVVLFGGLDLTWSNPFGDTWVWDGTAWVQASPSASPGPRMDHAMAYDVARKRVVLFGGYYFGDTWEWNGARWIQRTPATSPAIRWGHKMVYDIARKRVVLFGGQDRRSNHSFLDTWEWDGVNWVQRTPATHPIWGIGHAMAYDVARRQVVLFGGANSQTWEWDGTSWLMRSPARVPASRSGHAMAYDVARKRVVLFGGGLYTVWYGDTWEWDGTNWVQRSPTRSPSARLDHTMAYDAARQRVVLLGGEDNLNLYTDTWEWDGTNWTQRSPATRLPSSRGRAMAYDVARQRVVMFGGGSWNTVTWLYGKFTPAQAQVLGTGCPGSRGRPILTSADPYLGNPAFSLAVLSARANAPSVFGLSTGRQNQPVGPCTFYLKAPVVPLFATTNAAGFAESPKVALPADIALIGVTLYAQAIVVDPKGAAFGLAFTAGRRLVLGD